MRRTIQVAFAAAALLATSSAWAQAAPAPDPQADAAGDAMEAEMNCVRDELSPLARMAVAANYASQEPAHRKELADTLAPAIENCAARFAWGDKRRAYGADYSAQVLDMEERIRRLEAKGITAEKLDDAFMALTQEDRFALTDTGSADLTDEQVTALFARIDAKLTAAGFKAEDFGVIQGYLLGYARLYELGGIWAALMEQGVK